MVFVPHAIEIRLQRVSYMPKALEPGVLYVSEEFGTVAHLCPCGCGSKIRTPLGPTEWSLKVTNRGPSLFPSIGNWQRPCKSHYWIRQGKIIWASPWTPEQVTAGLSNEEERRRVYYEALDRKQYGIIRRLWSYQYGDQYTPDWKTLRFDTNPLCMQNLSEI